MKVYVEVTWDNGIDGEDVICVGETDNESNSEVEEVLKRYFGNSATLSGKNTVKTKYGEHFFWLEDNK